MKTFLTLFFTTFLLSTTIFGQAIWTYRHNTMICKDGRIWLWKVPGDYDQSYPDQTSFPIQLRTLPFITQTSHSELHSLALDQNGHVWGWGLDVVHPNTGNPNPWSLENPILFEGLDSIIDIASGEIASAFLKKDGTVWLEGTAHSFDFYESRPGLRKAEEISEVTEIEAGFTHFMALKKDGTVWVIGEGRHGELGDGHQPSDQFVMAPELTDIVKIAATGTTCFAIDKSNALWTWGTTLGTKPSENEHITTPERVPNFNKVKSIFTGGGFAFITKKDGSVWALGYNQFGTLGNGDTIDVAIPVEIPELKGISWLSSNATYNIAKIGDKYFHWGNTPDGLILKPKEIKDPCEN